ncbi:MAG: hypothetical protein A2018_06425 [Alphaproteobacteria bacterium GWF2_58_20]|nr:MAG: hypothetical protein A2018_06425 [Alphaproteobacteria bacterium GWF2_58_20]
MTGVQQEIVGEDEGGQRLDRYLRRKFPQLSQGRIQKLLRTGQIRVDGKRCEASGKIEAGQVVRIPPLENGGAEGGIPKRLHPVDEKQLAFLKRAVLFDDRDVLVLDKPAGLAVQGGSGLGDHHLDALLDGFAEDGERPRLVHRLDKDTTGVLVLARNRRAAQALTESFRLRETRKYYLAVVKGRLPENSGKVALKLAKRGLKGQERMEVAEDGDRAVSLYRVLDRLGDAAALVALWPQTGRTHQLRAHMAALGCPIVGDAKYGGGECENLPGNHGHAMLLHAWRIILPHPHKGILDVSAPVPATFVKACRELGLNLPGRGEDPFMDVE